MRNQSDQASDKNWLTLGQAAAQLGVHPATLRRWSDEGEIRALVTPGGHRRFAQTDLDAFRERRDVQANHDQITDAWVGKALTRVRDELAQHRDERPWVTIPGEHRAAYREHGQRLMSVAMHYIADSASSEQLLEEARTIGEAQGQLAIEDGHTLTEAMATAMFFKDALLEVAFHLPEHTRLNPKANTRLLRRINTLLNVVELGIGSAYEKQNWAR